MSAPDGATWRSGYATVCKTVYTSSILVVASIHIINGLGRIYERSRQVGRDQQAAYQPSGNGTSGQGAPLSLAARGDGSRRWVWTTKSSSGTGAIAVWTASSSKSYSTSLIALSGFREAMVAQGFCFQIERIARILTIRRPRRSWLLKCWVPRANTSAAHLRPSVRKITFCKN